MSARARRAGRPPVDDRVAATHFARHRPGSSGIRPFPCSRTPAPPTPRPSRSRPATLTSPRRSRKARSGRSASPTTTRRPRRSFTGSLTFQLFQNLTPNTVNMIEQFTNDGFYVNSGDYFPRIVTDFDSPLTTVIQGGATNDQRHRFERSAQHALCQRKRPATGTHGRRSTGAGQRGRDRHE